MYYKIITLGRISYILALITATAVSAAPEILETRQSESNNPGESSSQIYYKSGWSRVVRDLKNEKFKIQMIYDYNPETQLSRIGIIHPPESKTMTLKEILWLMEKLFKEVTGAEYNPENFIYAPSDGVSAFAWTKSFREKYVVLPFGERSVWCTTQEADEASEANKLPTPEV